MVTPSDLGFYLEMFRMLDIVGIDFICNTFDQILVFAEECTQTSSRSRNFGSDIEKILEWINALMAYRAVANVMKIIRDPQLSAFRKVAIIIGSGNKIEQQDPYWLGDDYLIINIDHRAFLLENDIRKANIRFVHGYMPLNRKEAFCNQLADMLYHELDARFDNIFLINHCCIASIGFLYESTVRAGFNHQPESKLILVSGYESYLPMWFVTEDDYNGRVKELLFSYNLGSIAWPFRSDILIHPTILFKDIATLNRFCAEMNMKLDHKEIQKFRALSSNPAFRRLH